MALYELIHLDKSLPAMVSSSFIILSVSLSLRIGALIETPAYRKLTKLWIPSGFEVISSNTSSKPALTRKLSGLPKTLLSSTSCVIPCVVVD